MPEVRLYEIPDSAPRRACRECGVEIAMVFNHATGKTVPVNTTTLASHFTDCPNPKRFSRKARRS